MVDIGDDEAFDLQAAVAHEVGHVLGIQHTDVADATMFPSHDFGDIWRRELHEDDQAAAQYLYGEGSTESPGLSCDSTRDGGGLAGCRHDGRDHPPRERPMLMLVGLLASNPALGATFGSLPDIETLAERSKAVIRGSVIETESGPCSLGICSTHTVRVESTLSGKAPQTVKVTVPGGRMDGWVQRASGVPFWEVGSTVILFVAEDDSVPLTGLLTVQEDRIVDELQRTVPARVDDLTALVRKTAGSTP